MRRRARGPGAEREDEEDERQGTTEDRRGPRDPPMGSAVPRHAVAHHVSLSPDSRHRRRGAYVGSGEEWGAGTANRSTYKAVFKVRVGNPAKIGQVDRPTCLRRHRGSRTPARHSSCRASERGGDAPSEKDDTDDRDLDLPPAGKDGLRGVWTVSVDFTVKGIYEVVCARAARKGEVGKAGQWQRN